MISVTALGLVGCGQKTQKQDATNVSAHKSEKKLADIYIDQMTQWVEALESVKDEASAQKAAAKIAKIKANMRTLSEDTKNMNHMKAALAFGNKGAEFQQLQTRMVAAMQRIAATDPALVEIMNKNE